MFDEKLSKQLSELSMLNFSHEELNTIMDDMNVIVKAIDKVRDFNIVSPHCEMTSITLSELRNDTHKKSFPQNKILKNSKNAVNHCFTVPKIIQEDL